MSGSRSPCTEGRDSSKSAPAPACRDTYRKGALSGGTNHSVSRSIPPNSYCIQMTRG